MYVLYESGHSRFNQKVVSKTHDLNFLWIDVQEFFNTSQISAYSHF